jgi:predicted transcriptional regulator
MGQGKDIPEDLRRRIIACKNNGLSQQKIAEVMGCSQTTVSRLLSSKKTLPAKRSGRPPIMTSKRRKKLTTALLKDKGSRRKNLEEVCKLFSKQNKGETVSRRTVQRALKKEGIRSCIPRRKPLISAANKVKRLVFAKKYKEWTVEDWKNVLWTDESTFCQFQKSGWGRVWRKPDEEHHEDCIAATVKHGPSRMFWASFSWVGLGPLVPLKGSVTGAAYREILATHAIPTLKEHSRKVRKKFFFQEDNAPVHTAKVAREFLYSQKVEFLEWPPQSPDLNPIEELWSFVESGLRKREHQPSNLRELEEIVAEVWAAIPKETYRNLISSMPRRIQAVLSANGGHTTH